jgi:hypothetical protein
MVLLQDPLRLGDKAIAIPRPVAPLLALMDGTRDEESLEAALRVRTGVRLAPGLLTRLLSDLDEALLLDNDRFAAALEVTRQAYRQAAFRPLTLDGASFPSDPGAASAQLQGYLDSLPVDAGPPLESIVRGVISPHIDYQRGGSVYAEVWRAAAQAAREAELAIIFGTDHRGGPGTLTLTRQSYATPWGILPTEAAVVDALAAALGEDVVFSEELHHRNEHSIELAAVWLHFVRAGNPIPMVPILCGSFAPFVAGDWDPASYSPFVVALDVLSSVLHSQRTLVVAAADLAHMGPAFGDSLGLDFIGRAQLRNSDERLLQAVCAGDATAFFQQLQVEGDRRHVCGLPPIYLTLRLLDAPRASGRLAGYALCPADAQGASFVSIAGALLY